MSFSVSNPNCPECGDPATSIMQYVPHGRDVGWANLDFEIPEGLGGRDIGVVFEYQPASTEIDYDALVSEREDGKLVMYCAYCAKTWETDLTSGEV